MKVYIPCYANSSDPVDFWTPFSIIKKEDLKIFLAPMIFTTESAAFEMILQFLTGTLEKNIETSFEVESAKKLLQQMKDQNLTPKFLESNKADIVKCCIGRYYQIFEVECDQF